MGLHPQKIVLQFSAV